MSFAVVFAPIQLLYVVVFVGLSGRWDLFAAILGLCIGSLGAGAGVGSWLGSIWQIPQPPPGANLLGKNGAGGMAGFLGAMVGMFLPGVFCIPVIVFAVLAAVLGAVWGFAALAVGVLTAWLVGWWGIRSGGHRLDRTWPEVLAKVTWKG